MKIAIIGSREFPCPNFVKEKVGYLCETLGRMETPLTIISGGANGVDTWAEEVAKGWEELGVKILVFKANWQDLSHPDAIIKTRNDGTKYDARAGHRRNKLIIDEATNIIAFWDGTSKGTKHSIDLAIKANKPIDIYVRS